MRFRLDGEGNSWRSTSPHSRPARETLTHEQRVEFLKLLHDGLGVTMACAKLGIGVRDMKRLLATTPSFRRAVAQIEVVRAERMFALLYEAALNGDMKAAQFLLARHDRQVERRKARRRRRVLNRAAVRAEPPRAAFPPRRGKRRGDC